MEKEILWIVIKGRELLKLSKYNPCRKRQGGKAEKKNKKI